MEKGHFLNLIKTLLFKTEKNSVTLDTFFKQLDEWNVIWATSLIMMIHEEYHVCLDCEDIGLSETVGDLYQVLNLKQKSA